MKSCDAMRSIDQGMGSELAASEPKWGVATRESRSEVEQRILEDIHQKIRNRYKQTQDFQIGVTLQPFGVGCTTFTRVQV